MNDATQTGVLSQARGNTSQFPGSDSRRRRAYCGNTSVGAVIRRFGEDQPFNRYRHDYGYA